MLFSMKRETCFGKVNRQPLTQYDYEFEADNAAEFLKYEYNTDLIPYCCNKCGSWHLTPTNRQTPSKECTSCFDGNGNTKQAYDTKSNAKQRANILHEEQGKKLRVNQCQFGNGWHLTKI